MKIFRTARRTGRGLFLALLLSLGCAAAVSVSLSPPAHAQGGSDAIDDAAGIPSETAEQITGTLDSIEDEILRITGAEEIPGVPELLDGIQNLREFVVTAPAESIQLIIQGLNDLRAAVEDVLGDIPILGDLIELGNDLIDLGGDIIDGVGDVLGAIGDFFGFGGGGGSTCETQQAGIDGMNGLKDDIIDIFNRYIVEMANFIDFDLGTTATTEMMTRLDEFDRHLYPPLRLWWNDDVDNDAEEEGNQDVSTLPALKAMTRQISFVRSLQTMHIGMMLDASYLNENLRKRELSGAEAHTRYRPNETTCQLDSMNLPADFRDGSDTAGEARGQNKAYIFSRAFSRALAREDTKRRNNYLRQTPIPDVANASSLIRSAHAAPEPNPGGKPAEILELFRNYVACFCDPALGDEGCPETPPTTGGTCVDHDILRGKLTDIPEILWGNEQTFDMTNPDNRLLFAEALRILLTPFTPEIIPTEALDSQPGRKELMMRRGRDARLNAIYNVLAQMMSERAGGSGVDTTEFRNAAGLPASAAAVNASYASLRDVGKMRVHTPEFAARLVNDPTAVVRAQVGENATQLQLISDLHDRVQDMLVMEAAALAHELDYATPDAVAADGIPVRPAQ